MRNTETMKWDDIYSSWKYRLSALPVSFDGMFRFCEVPVDHVPERYPYYEADWWPNREFDMRALALRKDSGYLPSWETKRGTLHTAAELLRFNNNPETQTAIWIAGSVWDKIHALPDTWRGETYRMLDNILLTIRRQFADIDEWHHAARNALPFSITERYQGEELHIGQKFDDFLYLCILEAAIINGNWKLIRFVPYLETNS